MHHPKLGEQVTDTTTLYLDTTYISKNRYDEWNRLIRQQYQRGNATPKIFDHRYNRYGYLDRLERGNLVLWRATAQDASQHVSQAQLGNGLDVKYDYNPHTSRLKQSILQNSQGNALLQEGYTYDVLGNVDRRSQYWNNSGYSEGFTYDELNRLESATVDGQASQHFRYDAIGNILSKAGVGMGDYVYPAFGSNSVRPHAVKQIPGIGAHEYDDNGNLLSTIRSSRWVNIDWTSFDMPKRISKGEADSSQFTYGPEHQRSKQTKISQPNGNPTVTTTYYAGAQEADINNGQATVKTYWPYGLGVEIDQPGSNTSELHWSHHDRLGSIISITDASGNLKEKLAYDSWGKRRTTDGSATPDNLDGQVDNKGYTVHEMLDQLDLVHMNGRIYDPLMARFLSADPMIQDPAHSQSYNRYTYVWNNPTNLTDPTGYRTQDDWIQEELKRQAAKDPFGNWSVTPARTGSVTATVLNTENKNNNSLDHSAKPPEDAANNAGSFLADAKEWVRGHVQQLKNDLSYNLDHPLETFENATVPFGGEGAGVAAASEGILKGGGKLVSWLGKIFGKEESLIETAAERANQIHSVLDPRAQRARTTAVTETEEGVRVVSSSERRLSPAQRALLKSNEVEGVGVGHAEVTGVNAARQMGLTPTGTAASRPICSGCANTLQEEKITTLSPLK